MAMTPGELQDFLWQLRFIADHAIVAARLQRDRCTACPPGLDPRHDLDFYVLAVDRLVSCANEAAANCGVAAASAAKVRFEEAVPGLRHWRNQYGHPDPPGSHGWVTYGEAIMRLLPDGGVEYLVDPRHEHHEAAERLYAELADILGPLPEVGPETIRLTKDRVSVTWRS